MPQNYELTKRYDASLHGLNVVIYVSDLAVRFSLRDAPVEREVAIAQGSGSLGVGATLSFIGTADHEQNVRIANAVRAAAKLLLLSGDTFSPIETRYLRSAERMPDPEQPGS